MTDPGSHSLPGWLSNLELYRPLGFLLQHNRPGCDGASVADVSDTQLNQVAARSLLSMARLKSAKSR